MVVQDVLTRARALGLCAVSECIVRAPNTLAAFTIRMANAVDKVERKGLMVRLLMHRFMEFRNGRDELDALPRFYFVGPMFFDSLPQVDEPLARDIVADKNEGDVDGLEDGSKNIIHVCVPVIMSKHPRLELKKKK